eukprot:TRINITY_DN894_c0_g2_i5.p1 TRINITY_DN894_c0_g2~~TRINITY_DN894_c0_g2_i5.p1  ORF type:complete len:1628 (-),score=329.83 TRINITY_DN894_c0_g2_i5:65-4318(-)
MQQPAHEPQQIPEQVELLSPPTMSARLKRGLSKDFANIGVPRKFSEVRAWVNAPASETCVSITIYPPPGIRAPFAQFRQEFPLNVSLPDVLAAFWEQSGMSVNNNSDAFREQLLSDDTNVLRAVWGGVARSEQDRLAQTLIQCAEKCRPSWASVVLQRVSDAELAVADAPATMFRINSPLPKLLGALTLFKAKEAMRGILGPLFADWCQGGDKYTFEVDSQRLDSGPNLDANREHLENLVLQFLAVLCNSCSSFPRDLRMLCQHIWETVRAKFGKPAKSALISCFCTKIFLPPLLSPEKYDLPGADRDLKPSLQHGLVQLVKVLQGVTTSEPSKMKPGVISDNIALAARKQLSCLCKNLVSETITSTEFSVTISAKDDLFNLTRLHAKCRENMQCIRNCYSAITTDIPTYLSWDPDVERTTDKGTEEALDPSTCTDPQFKRLLDLLAVELHSQENYVLRVQYTDCYFPTADINLHTLPLSNWPYIAMCLRLSLHPKFEIVDKETYLKDIRISKEIAEVLKPDDVSWNFNDDESFFFERDLFSAVTSTDRGWPCVPARVIVAPLPPNTPTTFYATVHIPGLDGFKTFSCTGDKTNLDLMTEVIRKTNKFHGLTVETAIFKTVGQEQYMFDNMPLKFYVFVRNMLKRGKRVPLVLVPATSCPREQDQGVFGYVDIPPPFTEAPLSSLETSRPYDIHVGFASNFPTAVATATTEQVAVSVEGCLYYGGRPISDYITTSPTDLTSKPVWSCLLPFGKSVAVLPRETRVCFTVYSHVKSKQKQASSVHAKISMAIQQPLAGKAKTTFWTSFRVFDHLACLKTGTLTLPLKEGEPNPVGIAMDSVPTNDTSMTLTVTINMGPGLIVFPDTATIRRKDGASCLQKERRKEVEPNDDEGALLNTLIDKDLLYPLTNGNQKLLWTHRKYCMSMQNGFAKLPLAIPFVDPHCIAELYPLIPSPTQMDPLVAMELLDAKFADARVRSFAVSCLAHMSWSELADFFMQLVQALKCETYHSSDLARFLLRRALENRAQIGYMFFWLLKSEMHYDEVHNRFKILLKYYLRGSGEHREMLYEQAKDVETLMAITTNPKNKTSQAFLEVGLLQAFVKDGFHLPHDPCLKVSHVIPDKCKTMDSLRAPLWLVFENYDPLGDNIYAIFKADDDLRQDMLSLQIIAIMNKVWQQEELDLQMTLYTCLALGKSRGMIEVVLESQTIAHIQKVSGGGVTAAFKDKPLASWLREHCKSDNEYNIAVENFIHSCAGYCVATYVLGVGDRHNDNIMLTERGCLFHIDFGHILGNAEKFHGIKRDRAPFVLTPEMVFVMGGDNDKNPNWQRFIELCCRAFICLRRRHRMFINLFAMMLSTGMPELRTEDDIEYLRTAFLLEKTESEARAAFEKLVYKSLDTLMTRVNNAIHIAVHSKVSGCE